MLQPVKNCGTLFLLSAALLFSPAAQAQTVKCDEPSITEGEKTQMEFCSTWLPCNIGLSAAGAMCRGRQFIEKIKDFFSDKKSIDADDVMDSLLPDVAITPSVRDMDERAKSASRERLKVGYDWSNSDRSGRTWSYDPAKDVLLVAAKQGQDQMNGVVISGKGVAMRGNFKNGVLDGPGQVIQTNVVQGGNFQNGQLDGQGYLISKAASGGSILSEGNFAKGMPQGELQVTENGTKRYRAELREGGIYQTSAASSVNPGEVMQAGAILRWEDEIKSGDQVIGEMRNGKPFGVVERKQADGRSRIEFWEFGRIADVGPWAAKGQIPVPPQFPWKLQPKVIDRDLIQRTMDGPTGPQLAKGLAVPAPQSPKYSAAEVAAMAAKHPSLGLNKPHSGLVYRTYGYPSPTPFEREILDRCSYYFEGAMRGSMFKNYWPGVEPSTGKGWARYHYEDYYGFLMGHNKTNRTHSTSGTENSGTENIDYRYEVVNRDNLINTITYMNNYLEDFARSSNGGLGLPPEGLDIAWGGGSQFLMSCLALEAGNLRGMGVLGEFPKIRTRLNKAWKNEPNGGFE